MVTPLRVLMLGTPAFAVPTFEALLASRHDVVALICQPDRPRGRGHKVTSPPTKVVAEAHGVPIFQPIRLKDESSMRELAELRADIGVVAAYGRILPNALIDLPARGMINVHASLLPRYRGAAPIHRAVIAGDDTTGVTIMRVVQELDAGPMLAAAAVPIAPDATSVDVERELASVGASLLVDVLDRLADGEAVSEVPQDARLATYAPKIERADGAIDWSRSAVQVHNLVRGLHPWPHAYTFLLGERLLVHRTAVNGGKSTRMHLPGSILSIGPDRIDVATGDGILHILQLQPEGRRVMPVRDWIAGRRDVAAGAQFTSGPS